MHHLAGAAGWLGRKGMFQGKRRFEAWGRVRFSRPATAPAFAVLALFQGGICAPATQTARNCRSVRIQTATRSLRGVVPKSARAAHEVSGLAICRLETPLTSCADSRGTNSFSETLGTTEVELKEDHFPTMSHTPSQSSEGGVCIIWRERSKRIHEGLSRPSEWAS